MVSFHVCCSLLGREQPTHHQTRAGTRGQRAFGAWLRPFHVEPGGSLRSGLGLPRLGSRAHNPSSPWVTRTASSARSLRLRALSLLAGQRDVRRKTPWTPRLVCGELPRIRDGERRGM